MEHTQTILNFHNPYDMNFMESLAVRILTECNGKSFGEVMDRLTAKFPPSKVIESIETVWIENVFDKEKVLEGLRPEIVEGEKKN